MDFKEVQSFIKFVTKSGASEVSLETEEYKITVKSGSDQPTVITPPQAPPIITTIPSPPSLESPAEESKSES